METTMSAGGKKGYKGFSMEGPIARWYARITAKDLAEFRRLAGTLAGRLGAGGAVLEVAPGPGYLAIELAKLGPCRVTGLDISRSFVRIAGENARRAGVSVEFRHGNAAAMPFDPDSFDFLVCRAAFKNFSEPVKALDEMHRVLRPGGEALIIDLRSDVRRDEIDAHVERDGARPVRCPHDEADLPPHADQAGLHGGPVPDHGRREPVRGCRDRVVSDRPGGDAAEVKPDRSRRHGGASSPELLLRPAASSSPYQAPRFRLPRALSSRRPSRPRSRSSGPPSTPASLWPRSATVPGPSSRPVRLAGGRSSRGRRSRPASATPGRSGSTRESSLTATSSRAVKPTTSRRSIGRSPESSARREGQAVHAS